MHRGFSENHPRIQSQKNQSRQKARTTRAQTRRSSGPDAWPKRAYRWETVETEALPFSRAVRLLARCRFDGPTARHGIISCSVEQTQNYEAAGTMAFRQNEDRRVERAPRRFSRTSRGRYCSSTRPAMDDRRHGSRNTPEQPSEVCPARSRSEDPLETGQAASAFTTKQINPGRVTQWFPVS